jgi:hypothetical protein
MSVQTASTAKSEQKILTVLSKSHAGRMALRKLVATMRKAGLKDETRIRSAIWKLISESRIERDADMISISKP